MDPMGFRWTSRFSGGVSCVPRTGSQPWPVQRLIFEAPEPKQSCHPRIRRWAKPRGLFLGGGGHFGPILGVSGFFVGFKPKWVLLDLFPDFFLMVPTLKKSLQKRCQELENVCVFKFQKKRWWLLFCFFLCFLFKILWFHLYNIYESFLSLSRTNHGRLPIFCFFMGITLKSTPFRKIVPETTSVSSGSSSSPWACQEKKWQDEDWANYPRSSWSNRQLLYHLKHFMCTQECTMTGHCKG